MRNALKLVPIIALIVVSCSSVLVREPLIGIRASTDPAVGDSRLLFAVSQIDGTRRGSPEEVVTVEASHLDHPGTVLTDVAVFTWVIPDSVGLYIADIPFDEEGTWQIVFTISTGEPTEPFLVDVQAEPRSFAIGDEAPKVPTPTLSSTPIEDLTTDHDPLAALYETSLDTALLNGRKTVVLFATPSFCTSGACGPMLDQVKRVAGEYPHVDFIHIEVYEGFNEQGFVPDTDHLAPAVVAFGLPSEPWVFVIDSDGVIIGRFDGVLGSGELEDIIES